MVYFTPNAPLQPSTAYVANLTYCGSETPVAVGFSTSDLGTAADDVTVFEGKTYSLDLSSGNFVQPAGVGDLIGGLLENNILVFVIASFISRGLRFFIVSYLSYKFGYIFTQFMEKHGSKWFTIVGILIVIIGILIYLILKLYA